MTDANVVTGSDGPASVWYRDNRLCKNALTVTLNKAVNYVWKMTFQHTRLCNNSDMCDQWCSFYRKLLS